MRAFESRRGYLIQDGIRQAAFCACPFAMEGKVLKKAAQNASLPGSVYGIFKTANEHCARVYWEEECIRSIGLRPGIVYGPGRDRGLSAGPTGGGSGPARARVRNRFRW